MTIYSKEYFLEEYRRFLRALGSVKTTWEDGMDMYGALFHLHLWLTITGTEEQMLKDPKDIEVVNRAMDIATAEWNARGPYILVRPGLD